MRRPLLIWITLALAAATLVWLGYTIGRVQSIAEITQLGRDADTDRYTLSQSGLLIHFERLGGAGKPYVQSGDGLQLLDVSDWDRDSRVVVDGTLFELVRLYPQSSVDYGRGRIAETLNGDGWLLQREITVEADGTVDIEHMFVARRAIQRVDLSLAHVHQTFVELHVDEHTVTGLVSPLTEDQIAAGVTAAPAYQVQIGAASDSPPIHFRYGASTPYGQASFIADMAADQPTRDTRVSLGHEVIRVERASGAS